MPTDPPMPLSAAERAQMKQWLDRWRLTGPMLEEERLERLRELTDQDAVRQALLVWQFRRPDWPSDDGAGLLLFAQVQQRARVRP